MHAQYLQRFSHPPQVRSQAPGRINLIGEHTDYNDGFVMPGAIGTSINFLLGRNGESSLCRVYSVDMEEQVEVDLRELQPGKSGHWSNYLIGVAAELQKKGAKLEGFDCIFQGDIPLGAGLSSSAALECALAVGLNELFDLGYGQIELIKVSQRAEHHYAGVACGIMDQFASMMGQAGQVFRLDCRSLEYTYFPLELGEYQWVLVDSCVKHSLADSAYNERRAQCEMAVNYLQDFDPAISKLRDVTLAFLEAHKEGLDTIVYQRALHVLGENQRVLLASEALQSGDLPWLGQLLYQSHDSLSRQYEVSCPELDFLADYTADKDYVLGARMMGGGFGGCTLNLVAKDKVEGFSLEIAEAYQKKLGKELKVYPVELGKGAFAERV